VIAPLLAMVDQAGMTGEPAGNALRKVLQLSMDTKKTGAYGLNFTNGKGEHAGLQQMFAQLSKLKSMNTEKRLAAIKDIFGNDGETIQILTLMIEKGQTGYADMVSKLQGQADLQARVNESLGTLSAAWESAEGTWTNLKAAFGEALAPELKAITRWLGETTAKMQAWTAENPRAARFLMLLAAVIGVLLMGLGALAVVAAGFLVTMAAMAVAAATIGIGLLPLTLIIVGIGAAIALVVAGFVYFREELGAAWDVFSSTWMAIGTWWQQFSFFDLGRQVAIGLQQGMISGARWIWDAATGLATEAVNAVKEKLGIRSPSRVFAQLGAYTTAGMEMGVTGGTPAAVSTVQRLAQQVSAAGSVATLTAGMALGGAPGMAGAAGAQPAGGMSIGQVTIVIQGGDDPQAIARAVEDRLRALNNRQRSDAQARFYQD
jgi:hypothetical protein